MFRIGTGIDFLRKKRAMLLVRVKFAWFLVQMTKKCLSFFWRWSWEYLVFLCDCTGKQGQFPGLKLTSLAFISGNIYYYVSQYMSTSKVANRTKNTKSDDSIQRIIYNTNLRHIQRTYSHNLVPEEVPSNVSNEILRIFLSRSVFGLSWEIIQEILF